MFTAARTNSFVADASSAAALHRLVQPFEVAGMGLNEALLSAAILLIERGEPGALEIVRQALGCSEEIELRALLQLQESLRAANSGGER